MNIYNIRKRAGELLIGHTLNSVWDYVFDFILYPAVIWILGPIAGFFIMSFASLGICMVLIRLYDWSKRDWLGIEAVKSLKDYAGPNRFGRALAWILRQSEPVACVLLSLRYDPFIVTVYLRHGRFGGMTRRDWRIFLLSWFIANAWWSVVCFTGLSAVEWIWNWWKSGG